MKRRVSRWLAYAGCTLLAVLSLGSLIWLNLREQPRRTAPPAARGMARGVASGADAGAGPPEPGPDSAEQVLLAAENARTGAPEPPGTAALFRTAETAVRAVLTGTPARFARYGLPGTGIELVAENIAEVSGVVAVGGPGSEGQTLRYRVKILFLPGGYREALWPEFEE